MLLAIQAELLMKYGVHPIHDYQVNHSGEIVGLQVLPEKLPELRDILAKHDWRAGVTGDRRGLHIVTLRPDKHTCKVGDS